MRNDTAETPANQITCQVAGLGVIARLLRLVTSVPRVCSISPAPRHAGVWPTRVISAHHSVRLHSSGLHHVMHMPLHQVALGHQLVDHLSHGRHLRIASALVHSVYESVQSDGEGVHHAHVLLHIHAHHPAL